MHTNNLLIILQSCDLIKDLTEEFKKPFGWLRIKEKIECKKLKKELITKINYLKDDIWDIEYLHNIERMFIMYYDKLEPYLDDIQIQDHELKSFTVFKSIYFYETDTQRMIILDVVNDGITFTIFDTITGETLKIASTNQVSESQKKVVGICKQKIIDTLLRYLDNITTVKNLSEKEMIEKIFSNYSTQI